MKLIGTYRKSEVEWRNEPNRAAPVLYVRFAAVEVFRPQDGGLFSWLGFNDEEVVHWGPWGEQYVDWGAA